MDNGQPVEPDGVWTSEEWIKENPWQGMPKGDLRIFFKSEHFIHVYSGGPHKFRNLRGEYTFHGNMTGRFCSPFPEFKFPKAKGPDYTDLDIKVAEFLKKYPPHGD